MAILIVDKETLMYSPNISFLEDEIVGLTFPNGFFGDEIITETVINEFNIGHGNIVLPKTMDKVIPFPGCEEGFKKTLT